MTSRIAIIPARGGSKRIPNKNIIDFCGKPLIQYSLEAVRESGLFDKVHVSTDDEKIAETVEKIGFEIDFQRPHELSDDMTPIMPVLKNVIETYALNGLCFDQVCQIMATNPFIEKHDLLEVVKLFEGHNSKYPVITVAEYSVPIEWAYEFNHGHQLIPLNPGKFATRSQDLQPKYFDAGSVVLYPLSYIQNSEGAGIDTDFLGYKLPKYKGTDIDNKEDLELAKAIYKGMN